MTANELASTAATHLSLANTVLNEEVSLPVPEPERQENIARKRYFLWNTRKITKIKRWDRMRYGIRKHSRAA